jgi:hypothetical protein
MTTVEKEKYVQRISKEELQINKIHAFDNYQTTDDHAMHTLE